MPPAAWEQTHREVQVAIDLGPSSVLPLTFHAVERLGEPFHLELEVVSKDGEIDFLPHLGVAVGLTVFEEEGQAARRFHGLLARADHLDSNDDGDRYALTVRPWLWFLGRTLGYRIYQNVSALDVVRQVFAAAGFSDYVDRRVNGSGETVLEMCVKFRESDYDFVMRLMQEAGIYFYFDHQEERHVLVMCDGPGSHPVMSTPSLPYIPRGDGERLIGTPHVSRVREEISPSAQTVTLGDFNFTTPRADLTGRSEEPALYGIDAAELYDYPGNHATAAAGAGLAAVRLRAAQAERRRFRGESQAPRFACGALFTLTGHPNPRFDGQFLLVEVDYRVATEAYLASRPAGGAQDKAVAVRYLATPAATPWSAPLSAPRPVARGPQTAIVTGPPGETVYVDQYGRVKVHFHWDRVQPKDDTSSCWVRVSQGWAGAGFGMVNLPRVGQEVVVDFLDGNPDRPLVTGRVYNADTATPYALPDNKTRSTWKSQSVGGDGFNEIRYEDSAGSEEIFVQAQKDMNVQVLNSRAVTIGQDETTTVRRGDETHTVAQGKRTTFVQQGDSLTVSQGDLFTEVKAGSATTLVDVGDLQVTTTNGSMTLSAGRSITLRVGENSVTIDLTGVSVSSPAGAVSISASTVGASAHGAMRVSGQATQLSGTSSVSVSGGLTAEVTGEAVTTIKGALVRVN